MADWLYAFYVFTWIFIFGEIIITFIFRYGANRYYRIPQTTAAIIEGVLERFFIFLCFVNGIFVGLLFFGALKIATHINPHDNPAYEGKSLPKMYYLIGNLLSATFAVIYFMLWRWVTNSHP